MLPYTGDYTEHIDSEKPRLTFYSFTPRPLMRGDMYQMDDELAALLIEAHRNIGFLEGLVKYAPNKEAFAELMLLKECTYSHMIDYDGPDFKEILTIRGTGKGDITPITNLEMAFKAAKSMEVAAPDLSRICGIALNGESENNPIDVRDHQTFWIGAKTNLKGYNPTAPDAVLPALADISAYLYNDHNTDPLIKAALVHYQFEMIHPFERYNGIIGRILMPMILRDVVEEARPLICLSEYLYHNKNEYFDLLRTTQYSGGYIRWIKFFVNAIGQAAKQSAEALIKYEKIINEDEMHLQAIPSLSPSVLSVYEYFKNVVVTNASSAEKNMKESFNTISKAFSILEKYGYLKQYDSRRRNRIFSYQRLFATVFEDKSTYMVITEDLEDVHR